MLSLMIRLTIDSPSHSVAYEHLDTGAVFFATCSFDGSLDAQVGHAGALGVTVQAPSCLWWFLEMRVWDTSYIKLFSGMLSRICKLWPFCASARGAV